MDVVALLAIVAAMGMCATRQRCPSEAAYPVPLRAPVLSHWAESMRQLSALLAATRAIVLTGTPPGFCCSDVKELSGMNLAGMRPDQAYIAAMARAIALLERLVVAGVWPVFVASRS
jgi:hypothetical protein